MSRVVSGWVVSRRTDGSSAFPWRAWKSGELALATDTYRSLLAMIREANRQVT